MGEPRSKRPRFRRVLAALVLLITVLFGWSEGSAQTPAAPGVRIGTTSPEPALDNAQEGGDRQHPDPETHAPPGDAPRLETGLKLPPPPSNFNTHDGGWVRFAYEP